jgi:hypothetical protein
MGLFMEIPEDYDHRAYEQELRDYRLERYRPETKAFINRLNILIRRGYSLEEAYESLSEVTDYLINE